VLRRCLWCLLWQGERQRLIEKGAEWPAGFERAHRHLVLALQEQMNSFGPLVDLDQVVKSLQGLPERECQHDHCGLAADTAVQQLSG